MRCRQRFGRLFARLERITGKLSSAIRAVCRVVLIFAYKIFLECESKARIVHPRLFWGMAGGVQSQGKRLRRDHAGRRMVKEGFVCTICAGRGITVWACGRRFEIV